MNEAGSVRRIETLYRRVEVQGGEARGYRYEAWSWRGEVREGKTSPDEHS